MKKLIFAAAILFSCLTVQLAKAQISVSLNIGSQPDWGPTGYDHADYYYMPDIDTYYDVNNHVYVYNEGGAWVHRTYLPARYQSFDRYHAYKAVVNERTPWVRNDVYRTRYASYRGRRDQVIIRDSREERYRNHYREEAAADQNRAERYARAADHNRAVRDRQARVSQARHNNVVAAQNADRAKRIRRAERHE